MSSRLLQVMMGAVVLALAIAYQATAQPTRNRVDNRGKQFRLAFLQTNGADDAPVLAIIVAAERPTTGRITYLKSGKTVNIPLIQPNSPVRITLDTNDLLLPNPARYPVSANSLLLDFTEEVVVYGVNTQRWSSDSYLALPDEVLGTNHIILSYPNTIDPNPGAAFSRSSDFPSQFAIVATADNTVLTITPSARLTSRPDGNTFTVTLNAGEVYFAQAFGRAGTDLTGTQVASTKPVVVYGSHQRANIPWDEAVGRDHLVEQLPSVDRWGSRAILTPHYQLKKTINDHNIVRILAARNNTDIFIDSVFLTSLDARRFVEIDLDRVKLVTATGPILVAQFHHSSVDERFVSMPNDSVGDPFMMLDVPQEQFDSVYWFESYATKDFFFHYINVVIPMERVSSLRLDGFPVSVPFTRVANTSYGWAQIPVSLGFHKVNARAPFGLYAYGFGVYNSYGQPGAMVFDSVFKDQAEPSLSWIDTCGGAAGYALDDGTDDFGVESVRLLDGSVNVHLDVEPFKPGRDSVHYRLLLNDPYQDGIAEMQVVDTAGLDRRYRFPVKGFTVAMEIGQTAPILVDTLASLNGMQFCRPIILRNYGQFPQRITGLRFNSTATGLTATGEFPIELGPGEERTFAVCYQHVGDTSFSVEVMVDNGCLLRSIATVPLISGIDSTVPVIQPVFDPCEIDRTIKLSEEGALNSGLQSITFLDSSNVSFSLSTPLPAKSADLHLIRRDPYQDMIYRIEIADAVGNKTTISDIVGGFTLAVQSADARQVGLRVNRPWVYQPMIVGQERCDTFYLHNYGLLTLNLQRPRIVGNLEYSIPPDQLPIALKPGETRPLLICVTPRGSGDQIDTFLVDFNCGNPREVVELMVQVDPLAGSGRDRCGNRLTFQVDGFVKRNFLQPPMPNPASTGSTAIYIGLDGPQTVTLGLFDGLGNEKRLLFDNDVLPGGIVRVDAVVSDLPAGMYYLRMQTSTGTSVTQKLVIAP